MWVAHTHPTHSLQNTLHWHRQTTKPYVIHTFRRGALSRAEQAPSHRLTMHCICTLIHPNTDTPSWPHSPIRCKMIVIASSPCSVSGGGSGGCAMGRYVVEVRGMPRQSRTHTVRASLIDLCYISGNISCIGNFTTQLEGRDHKRDPCHSTSTQVSFWAPGS